MAGTHIIMMPESISIMHSQMPVRMFVDALKTCPRSFVCREYPLNARMAGSTPPAKSRKLMNFDKDPMTG